MTITVEELGHHPETSIDQGHLYHVGGNQDLLLIGISHRLGKEEGR